MIYKQDPFHCCATGAPLLQCLHPKLECRLLNRMTTYRAQSSGFFLQHSTPVNTALGQWRQEDQPLWVILNLEFEASLGYTKPSSKMLTVGAWVLPFLEKVKLKPSDVNHSGIFFYFSVSLMNFKASKAFLFPCLLQAVSIHKANLFFLVLCNTFHFIRESIVLILEEQNKVPSILYTIILYFDSSVVEILVWSERGCISAIWTEFI